MADAGPRSPLDREPLPAALVASVAEGLEPLRHRLEEVRGLPLPFPDPFVEPATAARWLSAFRPGGDTGPTDAPASAPVTAEAARPADG